MQPRTASWWCRLCETARCWQCSTRQSAEGALTEEDEAARKRLIAQTSARKEILDALEAVGYWRFSGDLADKAKIAAADLAAAFPELMRQEIKRNPESKKGSFLVSIMQDKAFFAYPSVMNLVTDERIAGLAARYLGEAPVLSGVNLWWSPVNKSATSSQLFHFDEADNRQLKLFLNVHEITADHGPFTLVPADLGKRVSDKKGDTHGRFTDEEVEALAPRQSWQSFEGPAGALAAVDSSRCLHYGSRGNTKERVVAMFQFTKCTAPLAQAPDWGQQLGVFLDGKSELQNRLFCR
ncbi:MAG: hypothetical protein HC855_09235 [Rhizobiales bacterium]|nr:hypothetical protein [Hyphomicrobiales bacterium]